MKSHPEENKELYDDLIKLYNDFGLMKNDEFGNDVVGKMKEIVRETQKNRITRYY